MASKSGSAKPAASVPDTGARISRSPANANERSESDPADKFSRLDYMRRMLGEFRTMADDMGEGTLVYLLDVTILEIDETANLQNFRDELTK